MEFLQINKFPEFPEGFKRNFPKAYLKGNKIFWSYFFFKKKFPPLRTGHVAHSFSPSLFLSLSLFPTSFSIFLYSLSTPCYLIHLRALELCTSWTSRKRMPLAIHYRKLDAMRGHMRHSKAHRLADFNRPFCHYPTSISSKLGTFEINSRRGTIWYPSCWLNWLYSPTSYIYIAISISFSSQMATNLRVFSLPINFILCAGHSKI